MNMKFIFIISFSRFSCCDPHHTNSSILRSMSGPQSPGDSVLAPDKARHSPKCADNGFRATTKKICKYNDEMKVALTAVIAMVFFTTGLWGIEVHESPKDSVDPQMEHAAALFEQGHTA